MSDSAAKLRASCDRCQNSKVRCSRLKPSCWRCFELGEECVYSPVKRIGRPRNAAMKLSKDKPKDAEQQSMSTATSNASQSTCGPSNQPNGISSDLVDPDRMTLWYNENMQMSYGNEVQLAESASAEVLSGMELGDPFDVFTGTDVGNKLGANIFDEISPLSGSSAIAFEQSRIISEWYDLSANFWQPDAMPSSNKQLAATGPEKAAEFSGSQQQAHEHSGTSANLSKKSGKARMLAPRGPCFTAAVQTFDKVNEQIPKDQAIPLDKLLNQNQAMNRAVHGVLECKEHQECAGSPALVMLLLIMLETLVSHVDKQPSASEAAAGEVETAGATWRQRSVPCTDVPLHIGSFMVDAEMKSSFLVTVLIDVVDTQRSMLLQLEAKANDVLQGAFREHARDLLNGMWQRLALVRERFEWKYSDLDDCDAVSEWEL